MTQAKAKAKRPSQPSRVLTLWADVETISGSDAVSDKLDFIDRLSNERVRDEYIRIPYGVAANHNCRW